MATIFQKTISDECLILEQREAFYYPFYVGNYQEVRAGFYFSATSTSGDNTPYNFETADAGSLVGSMFIGFAKSGQGANYVLPGTTGLIFCGLKNQGGNCSYLGPQGDIIWISPTCQSATPFFGCILTNYLSSGFDSIQDDTVTGVNNTGGVIFLPQDPTLDTGYASYFGISLNFSGNQFQFSMSNDANFVTDMEISGLRNRLETFPNYQLAGTGYFTSGFNNTNNIIDKPDSLFLYFPFYNNKIRIHALTVERYS